MFLPRIPDRWPSFWPGVWRTTVFRLTALYGAVFVVGVAALLALVYAQTAGVMTRSVDHLIDAGVASLETSDAEHLPTVISTSISRDFRGQNYFGLFSADGVWIGGNLHALPPDLRIDGRPIELQMQSGQAVRARAVRLPWGEILMVGRDVGQLAALRGILLQAMLISGGLILVLGLACGVALSIAPLRRLRDLQSASQVIMAGDLGARLPTSGARDELDMLAGIVNVMIADIERLLMEAKSVGDGLAHDLRTPLTRLRALLYRVLEETAARDVHRPMIEQALAETDTLLTRFRALLRISEIERQQRRSGFRTVDLKPVLEAAADLYGPLAEEKGVSLLTNLEDVRPILADGELLFEAVSNLIDNAIKFTPKGGQVRLDLQQAAHGPQIHVSDTGPGIPEAERALALQRFYRGDAVGGAPGSGLGLSIVAAVARLHGFALVLSDGAPGLGVSLNCWSGPIGS